MSTTDEPLSKRTTDPRAAARLQQMHDLQMTLIDRDVDTWIAWMGGAIEDLKELLA